MIEPQALWRAMNPADLSRVDRIAAEIHADYPERPDIAAERLRLFPAGCLIASQGEMVGYAIGHPGLLGQPPALDRLLGALPQPPDCLYLHDIALLPRARRLGLGRQIAVHYERMARALGLGRLALTAVHDSAPYWIRLGFQPVAHDAALTRKLASYGAGAAYLVAEIER